MWTTQFSPSTSVFRFLGIRDFPNAAKFVFLPTNLNMETASGTASDYIIPFRGLNFKLFLTNWAEDNHSGLWAIKISTSISIHTSEDPRSILALLPLFAEG